MNKSVNIPIWVVIVVAIAIGVAGTLTLKPFVYDIYLSSTVDKDNILHILVEVKDEWHNDKWRMMYYEFNPFAENSQS